MKKIFLIATLFVASMANAQSIGDALRLSNTDVTGTARFRAMSGAFGALGGDLSAIGINPASSAVFTKGTVSFSLVGDNRENQTTYFGNGTNLSDSNVNINQAGGVFVVDTGANSRWKKITLGFNYDRTGNFDDSFIAAGLGDTSISSYFNAFAQGVPLDLLETIDGETVGDLYQFLGETEGFGAQQALLGFQSFIIDPQDPGNLDNIVYIANTGEGTFDQEYLFNSTGYNGKASFNLGAQYNENLYVGVNLNSHFFDYNQRTILFENSNTQSEGLISLREVQFENNLNTFGNGFSFQAGFIGKIQDNLRVGFSYDSPTWYTISEEGTQNIRTVAEDNLGTFETVVNPRVVNVFENYTIKIPAKYTGSIAYLFGQKGLISFDYAYTDFRKISFRPQGDPFFRELNGQIENSLTAIFDSRLGGEFRLNEWSFRAGARYYGAFEDGLSEDGLFGSSLGIGYNFGNTKLDVAYDRSQQDRTQTLFNTGLTSAASINNTNTAIVATLTLSL